MASSWPIDALVQPLLHVNQLLDLALHQPADGNVRPLADDLGDVLLVDFLLQHPLALLKLGEPRFRARGFRSLELRDPARTAARTPWRSRRRAAPRSISRRTASSSSLSLRACWIASFSCCQCVARRPRSSLDRRAPSRACRAAPTEALSFSLRSASRSISSCMMRRSISSSSAGIESISIRSFDAASSTRSIALSGRNRSAM